MNTIKLTRENLHDLSASPGKCGFTKKQIEALGFSWPPEKGWLSSLIGKEIPLAEYEMVKGMSHKKWEKRDHQQDCRTLDDVQGQIREVFAHPDWKIEGFDVRGVTPTGHTIRLRWDRRNLVPKMDTTFGEVSSARVTR